MNEEVIKKDMEKYNSATGLKFRADLSELYSILQKKQYEMFLLDKAYKKLLGEYQEYIGLKEKKNDSTVQ